MEIDGTNPEYGLSAVSCSSSSSCAAVEAAEGNALTYNGSLWSAPVGVDSGNNLWSVSCPSAVFCAAVDLEGNALIYNGSSWTLPVSIDSGKWLNSVSCASASFCVAVDNKGNALTYNGSAWSPAVGIDGTTEINSVSCPSSSFCVAVDSKGSVITFDGASWSAPVSIDAGESLTSVSCSSVSFCVAVRWSGAALTYHSAGSEEPGGGGSLPVAGTAPLPSPPGPAKRLRVCRARGQQSLRVPKGYVITKREGRCVEVSLPTDGIVVCENSAPNGYVVLEKHNFDWCGPPRTYGGYSNGIRIRRLGSEVVICYGRVPAGYVVTRVLTVAESKCGPTYSNREYNAYEIEQPRDGMVICDRSSTPTGYVVTELQRRGEFLRSGICGIVFGNKEYNAYRIEQPRDGMVICDRSSPPTGYVISEVREDNVPLQFGTCGPTPFRQFRITHPKANMVICLSTKAPPGYVVTERLVSGKCGQKPSYLRYNALRIAVAIS